MSDTTQHEPSLDAQALVNQLMKNGMSAHAIAEKLGQRVSYRTIYRWAKGECAPHQPSDLEALRAIARGVVSSAN